jgi:hypothetical protein
VVKDVDSLSPQGNLMPGLRRVVIGLFHAGDNDLKNNLDQKNQPPYGHLTSRGKERTEKLRASLNEHFSGGLGFIAGFAGFWNYAADSAFALLDPLSDMGQVKCWAPFHSIQDLFRKMAEQSEDIETLVIFTPFPGRGRGVEDGVLDHYKLSSFLFGIKSSDFDIQETDDQRLSALVVDLEARKVIRIVHELETLIEPAEPEATVAT